jgi:PAS domain S-box-containing protein
MAGRSKKNDKAGDLRRQAEKIVREKAPDIPEDLQALSPEAARKLLHELRLHQIEMEMQNEELRTAQEKLEESRAQYFELYDVAPVGYFSISDKGIILEANLTGANLLGAAPRDLRARQFSSFIFRVDQDVYYLHRKQLFKTRAPQVSEIRMVRDGAMFWARLEATLAQDSKSGKPVYLVTMSDVTDRKLAEEELGESQERYRFVMDQLPAITWAIDRSLVFTLSQGGGLAALGLQPDKVVGMSLFDYFGTNDPDHKAIAAHIRAIGGEKVSYEYEHQGAFFQTRLAPLYGAGQQPVGVTGIAFDITARKKAEAVLLSETNSLRRMAVMVRDSNDAITVQDLWGLTQAWNPGAVRMYGWSEAEALDMNVRSRIPEGEAEKELAMLKKIALGNTIEPHKTQRLTRDGNSVDVWLTASALIDEAGRVYAISTTERKIGWRPNHLRGAKL